MRTLELASLLLLASLSSGASAQTVSSSQSAGSRPRATHALPSAGIVFVDDSATGANDGSSWANAFVDLQSALASITKGELWVAAGTYRPGPSGDQSATFQLEDGVRLYGGFNGTETSLAQRDVQANPTILSGDIDMNDTYGGGANWWQFNWNGNSGNSHHIVTGSGVDASALLDGFTLFAGLAADPLIRGGAGLVVDGGSPSIRNCTFQYNALGYGSSARLMNCNSVFENCVIKDAYACNCGSGGWTSGVLLLDGSNVTFLDCEFLNHYYVSSMSQGRGAALNIDLDCSATLVGCLFQGNQTGNFYPIGGGTAYAGGVFAFGDVTIDRCSFIDNFAHAGAGLTIWSNASVTNSLFARNRAVSHPNSSGFNDGGYGAGLLTVGGSGDTVEVTGCTFVEGNSDKGAGMAFYAANVATVRNTIAYHNYADPPEPGEDEVWILKQNLVGNYDLANCCVEGLLQTEPGEDPPDPANFPGCVDTPPGFADLVGGDYQLQSGSPCVDSGDNLAVPLDAWLDLNGAPRFHDDPGTPDTGVGTAPFVDMGAYETGSVPL